MDKIKSLINNASLPLYAICLVLALVLFELLFQNIMGAITVAVIVGIPIIFIREKRIKEELRQKESFLLALNNYDDGLSFSMLEISAQSTEPIIIGWNKCYFLDEYLLNWTNYEIVKLDSVSQISKSYHKKNGSGFFPFWKIVLGSSFQNGLTLTDSYGSKLHVQTEWSELGAPSMSIGDETLLLDEMIEVLRSYGSIFETAGGYHEKTFQHFNK